MTAEPMSPSRIGVEEPVTKGVTISGINATERARSNVQ